MKVTEALTTLVFLRRIAKSLERLVRIEERRLSLELQEKGIIAGLDGDVTEPDGTDVSYASDRETWQCEQNERRHQSPNETE